MGKELVDQRNRKNLGRGVPELGSKIDLINDMLIWGGWAGGIVLVVYAVWAGTDFLEIALLTGLYALCIVPFIAWYQGGIKWMPLGEAFVLLHLPYYVLPALLGRKDWSDYSETQHVATLSAVALFLLAFLVVYQSILRSGWKAVEEAPIFYREMRSAAMWAIFGFWIIGSVMQAGHLVPNWAGFRNVFETFLTAVGALGIAYIFYQMGCGKLAGPLRGIALAGFAIGMLAGFANGFLQGNAQTLGIALLAYTLGSKRVPVTAIVLCTFMVIILQLGKGEFRAMAWNQKPGESSASPDLSDKYQTWINAGWQNLMTNEHGDGKSQDILDRVSLVNTLALAMADTPATQPFIYGETYSMLPQLLVPRYFWPNKPRGTLASETIGLYYGLQTEQSVNSTGISIGPLVEAWASFGWCGMMLSASFFGALYGCAARVSLRLVPSQVGWLLAAVILTYSVKMELCVAELCCSLLQALLVATILLYVLSYPPTSTRIKSRPSRLNPMSR